MAESTRLERIEELMMDLVKQNIQIGQRFDQIGQRFDQVGQRIEQANAQLGQRIDETNNRLDEVNKRMDQRIDMLVQQSILQRQQTQQQQLELFKMFTEIKESLAALHGNVKSDKIGFFKHEE